MCVISHTFDDHIHRLKKTFDSLLRHGLRLKADKCSLAMREVDFCGHRITSSGLQPIPTNTAAVTNLQVPRSVRDVKAFLGVTGWYRKFIPKYADLAKPLIKLTEKHHELFWTDDCQVAFEALKHRLMSAPVLTHPDPGRQFVLTTDASAVGIGAELAQRTPAGLQPVTYFSRTLSKSERNYSTYDRELLAMVGAIRHFRHHLLGTRFTLRSDHRPLQFLQTTKDPWGIRRRARWLEDQQYNFTLEHVKGTQNPVADALSRIGDTVRNLCAPPTPTPTSLDRTPWTQDSFLQAQHDDDNLHDVLTYLRLDQQPAPPPYNVSWKNR